MLGTVKLGTQSGLQVSRLCLGTMNFGEPGRGHQGDWTLGLKDSKEIFKAAIDRGFFYFDCADIYGLGACEEVIGQTLISLLPRDEYVLTTKIAMPMGRNPNMMGLSRKHIMEGVDKSLKRLGHDYVDQLIIHRHPHATPGGNEVPIEETMEALHDVVKAGKALYLGGSSMFAWHFAELQMTAELHGWTKFISMQNHYNLIYREEEREMNPYCLKSGVALTPWSPLARGILAGAYRVVSMEAQLIVREGRTESVPKVCIVARRISRLRIASSKLLRSMASLRRKSPSRGCYLSLALHALLWVCRRCRNLMILLGRLR